MNAVKKFQVLYGEIVNSCKYLLKNGKDDEFSIATFVVFHSLEKENSTHVKLNPENDYIIKKNENAIVIS